MLERTLFYSLEPQGIDTPRVEGLRSYVMRLAAAHHTTPRALLGAMLAKYPFESDLPATPAEVMKALASNATGRLMREVTRRLELSTGRNLKPCSVERFAGLLSPQGFSRLRDPKFCPICVAEDNYGHGQLAWDVGFVEVCPVHNVGLLSANQCDAPAEQHLTLQQRPFLPGVCNQCGSIGHRCSTKVLMPATKAQAWIADVVAGTLAMSDKELSRCDGDTAISGLQKLVDVAFEGSSVRAALATGLSRASVGQWLLGRGKPSFAGLLRLCQEANCEVSGVLVGEFRPTGSERVPLDSPSARQYRMSTYSKEELKSKLEAAIKSDVPPTVNDFAQEHKTSARQLRNHFPALARELAQIGKAKREQHLQKMFEDAFYLYKRTARQRLGKGERVTLKGVQTDAGLPAYKTNTFRRRALLEGIAAAKGR